MPCIFCIAVFMALAGTVTAAVMDTMEERLAGKAASPIKRVTDTGSVARLEFSMPAAGKVVPVAVTVFKKVGRVRIQVLTHDLTRPDAEQLEEELAQTLGLRIVERSSAEGEAPVREAFEQEPASSPAAQPEASPRPVR